LLTIRLTIGTMVVEYIARVIVCYITGCVVMYIRLTGIAIIAAFQVKSRNLIVCVDPLTQAKRSLCFASICCVTPVQWLFPSVYYISAIAPPHILVSLRLFLCASQQTTKHRCATFDSRVDCQLAYPWNHLSDFRSVCGFFCVYARCIFVQSLVESLRAVRELQVVIDRVLWRVICASAHLSL
jgi:hypothetical protein